MLKEVGARSIRRVSIVAAPGGIEAVHQAHPDVKKRFGNGQAVFQTFEKRYRGNLKSEPELTGLAICTYL
jgi:hypothetical protein